MRPLLSGSRDGPLKKRVAATTRKANVYSVWIILIGNRPCKHEKVRLLMCSKKKQMLCKAHAARTVLQ
jgi:hypothetical protein